MRRDLPSPSLIQVGGGVIGGIRSTTLNNPQKHPHIQVWAVAGKRTIDEAAADLSSILTPEVKDFVVTQRSDLTVAGAKAQLLIGTGSEADSGDPSPAQTTLFTVGGKVWVLISHGEGTAERAGEIATMLKLITPADSQP